MLHRQTTKKYVVLTPNLRVARAVYVSRRRSISLRFGRRRLWAAAAVSVGGVKVSAASGKGKHGTQGPKASFKA